MTKDDIVDGAIYKLAASKVSPEYAGRRVRVVRVTAPQTNPLLSEFHRSMCHCVYVDDGRECWVTPDSLEPVDA